MASVLQRLLSRIPNQLRRHFPPPRSTPPYLASQSTTPSKSAKERIQLGSRESAREYRGSKIGSRYAYAVPAAETSPCGRGALKHVPRRRCAVHGTRLVPWGIKWVQNIHDAQCTTLNDARVGKRHVRRAQCAIVQMSSVRLRVPAHGRVCAARWTSESEPLKRARDARLCQLPTPINSHAAVMAPNAPESDAMRESERCASIETCADESADETKKKRKKRRMRLNVQDFSNQ
ncbi:hypothetical protein B0H14DRAFT_2622932 [Mycena olivaceomarginata]|nr:hypothetical protein B0H14DRAFT_2622932 [Mycena olivaceomarginata]